MKMRNQSTSALWRRSLLLVGLFGLIAAIYAAVQLLFDGMPLDKYLRGVGSFACFGFFLGGIYSFDSESELFVGSHPILRTLVSIVSGVTVGLIWHWPVEGVVLSGIVAILLGLLGMTWAKYVDFF